MIFSHCEEELPIVSFYDEEDESIMEYLSLHEEEYSNFIQILEESKLDRTMTAQNPHGSKYTLFLPGNDAFDRFFETNDNFDNLEQLLSDTLYVNAMARYHILNLGLNSNDFPFGALPDTTLSGHLLSMGFKVVADTTQYIINNNAPITSPNIELTNGYIHVIGEVLAPIIINSYEWLKEQGNYSILVSAMEETGIRDTFNTVSTNGNEQIIRNTLLAESDEVFNKSGIYSLGDLKDKVSDSTNYTDYSNGLYQFVAYHILGENYFLNEFEGENRNYNTYGSLPIQINGTGIDIKINEGVASFDTIVEGNDTTVIDFINIDYDNSNILTRNGAIHLITDVLFLYKPPRSNRIFEFYEDPVIKKASAVSREHTFDEPEEFSKIWWDGVESITYFKSSSEVLGCSNNDYLQISGDFVITYDVPKILPGKYALRINCDSRGDNNATIQVYLDGKKIGRDIDLTSGASQGEFVNDEPTESILIGHVDFSNYTEHEIRIQPLINGIFIWDYIAFIKE